MFVDKVRIYIKAGNGGDGAVSFYTEKYISNGGPDGGDGGNGGGIVFVAENRKTSLLDFRPNETYKAEDGVKGGNTFCHGKRGRDLEIQVPRGTIIKDESTGMILADLFYDGDRVKVLEGGHGGKGNARFKSSRRQAPNFAQSGVKTEKHSVILELKTIADVGIIGYPNVGKSTLLSVLSAAKPKIASYHFTTLHPNLGVCKYFDRHFTIADIPGLIEGAAQGVGLGHSFLRHIERTRIIVHVVDIASIERPCPVEDFKKINKELAAYSKELSRVTQIVALNKSELLDEKALKRAVENFTKKTKTEPIVISGITRFGLDELKKKIVEKLSELPPLAPLEFEPFKYQKRDTESFEIIKAGDNYYLIAGGLIDELARNVTLDSYDSVKYFQKKLKDSGVFKALKKQGAKDGDTVALLDVEFEYKE